MEGQFKNIKSRKILLILVLSFIALVSMESVLQKVWGENQWISLLSSFLLYGGFALYIGKQIRASVTLKKLSQTVFQRTKWYEMFSLVAINYLVSFGSVLLMFGVVIKYMPDWYQEMVKEIDPEYTGFWAVLSSNILIVVIGPIVEELIFRGALLYRFKEKYSLNKAIILSSLIFGLFHMDVVGATVFGIFMALIYIKTKNILVPMLIHMVYNLGTVLLAFIPGGADEPSAELAPDLLLLGAGMLAIGMVLSAIYFYKNWPHSNKKNKNEQMEGRG